jgi:phosphoribosylformylglycinamidine synthase
LDVVLRACENAHVPVLRLGTTGQDTLTIEGERPRLVGAMRARFEGWLPAYMAAGAA